MDELPSTIDELMAIDPLELSKRSPEAYAKYIAVVIAYHRNQRAARESGDKKSRAKSTTKGPASEAMKALVDKLKPARVTSPTGTGLRRI